MRRSDGHRQRRTGLPVRERVPTDRTRPTTWPPRRRHLQARHHRDGQRGAGTNGSQFFLVYGDSTLPPQYTVFGTIDETGLQTIEKVAAAGDDGSMSAGGGKPNLPIDITSVRLD